MVPTTLAKDYFLREGDHENTLVVEGMIERLKPLEEADIIGHARSHLGSVAAVREHALNSFQAAVGYEGGELGKWKDDFLKDLRRVERERNALKKQRDKLERLQPDAEDRLLLFTFMEKVERTALVIVAFVLGIIGYLSLVQIVKSEDTALPAFAVYLLPAAGVFTAAVLIKVLLGNLRGTSIYNAVTVAVLVAGLISSITWLVLFADFVAEMAKPVQFLSLEGGPQVNGHTSKAYIIAGVLAETLAAAGALARVTYIYDAKTVRSFGANPEWQKLNEVFQAKKADYEKLQRLITLSDSLIGKIEAARGVYVGKAENLYMKLRMKESP